MASTYLSKTFGSAGNRKTWTFSAWIKRAKLSTNQILFSANTHLRIYDDDKIGIGIDGVGNFKSSGVIRDTSGWYHIVYKVDTTLASNKLTLYINGSVFLQTDAGYSLNADTNFNNNVLHYIGQDTDVPSWFFDGQMAHVHFIDGTAYDASAFGETDATTGIWKAKTAPSFTYGTNGFFLKFQNSGSMGTDSSGNANNFTVNGTMTQTVDTPSNVFATWNPLDNYYNASTFSNGNNTVLTGYSNYTFNSATLAVSKGKWYWEVKVATSGTYDDIGIVSKLSTSSTEYMYTPQYNYDYFSNGQIGYNNVAYAYGSSYTTGDIISVAMDLDNNKLYFAKNGTWQNSGVPTSGATGTGAVSIGDASITPMGCYTPAVGENWNVASGTYQGNFGNGYFGTTAVSSAENPDDGIGIFEYTVPTGYKALCTKSINAQEYS